MNQYIEYLINEYFLKNNNMIKLLVETYYYDNVILLDENEGQGTLDRELSGMDNDLSKYIRPNTPIIYAFTTNMMKTAVKIGFTTQGALARLLQWQKYYPDAQLIGYWDAIEFLEVKDENGETVKLKVFFLDYPVHRETVLHGYDNITREEFNLIFDNLALEDFSFDLTKLKRHYSQEFFRNINKDNIILSKEIIEGIINIIKEKIKDGNNSDIVTYSIDTFEKLRGGGKPLPIKNYPITDLLGEAIKAGVDAINNSKTHLLLAAVMRFGKTFTAYNIIKNAHTKFNIVTSAKADTRESWRNDIYHQNFMNDETNFIFLEFDNQHHKNFILVTDRNHYLYESNYDDPDFIKNCAPKDSNNVVILYITLLDLSGTLKNNTHFIKERHKEIFNINWDLLIADETHYATRSEVNGKALGYNPEELDTDELKDYIEEDQKIEELNNKLIKPLKTKVQLHLSGTPYNIISSNEFVAENSEVIGRYSYTDMLEARNKWVEDHVINGNEKEYENPYFGVPDLIRFGMNLTKECREKLEEGKKRGITDSFKQLFEVRKDKLKFVYHDAIKDLMVAIFGNPLKSNDNKLVGFLNRPEIKKGEVMKHIVLCLPTVMACHAMKVLLDEYIFTGKNDVREVIVAVENTASIEFKTLKNQGIGYRSPEAQTTNSLNNFLNKCESQGKLTITLTVTKYMTAVSIPLWDSMFYMKDTQSTQEYDQNIFRICTRNVLLIFDKNGKLIDAVNLKPNVYLIDFKILRLFEVIQDSTRRQNTINGKLTAPDIEQTVKRNLKNMPIYIDSDINGKLSEMKELTAKDFMKYYILYNSERSIEETINIGKFDTVLHGNSLDDIINLFDKTHINKSLKTSAYTEDNPTSSPKMPDNNIPDEDDTYTNRKKKKQRDLILEDKKKRFKTFIKNILYFAMCLGGAEGLLSIIKQMEDNKEIEKMGDRFALTIDMLKTLDKNLNFIEHNELDAEIYNILMLYTDNSKKPIDKIKTLCKRIGQLGPLEVATPPELCEQIVKMVDADTIKKADSILLINEKYGEFLIAIQEIYGKEVTNKCLIVPSSEMGYMFCKKTIKDLELKTNILDIDDYNKNGYYDIEDWLLCPNQKLIEENMGKKFDIIFANPPFNLGVKMLTKWFDIANEICTVLPSTWLLGKQLKKEIVKHVDNWDRTEIESILGSDHFDAAIGGEVAIQHFIKGNENNSHYVKQERIKFDGKWYKECKEIRKYSNDELLVEFKNIIEPLYQTDNLDMHLKVNKKRIPSGGDNRFFEPSPNPDWYILLINRYKAGPYAIITNTKEIQNKIGIYKSYPDINNRIFYLNYDNIKNLYNSINYLKTYFCRISLYLSMHNDELIGGGALKTVPWFDFSDPIFNDSTEEIDIKLFKKYGVRLEIVNHILNILTNYYNLDLTKYKVEN